jgi:competence protein ComFC
MLQCLSNSVAIVATKPRTLRGPWTSGFALDWHTLSSTPIGNNAFGHMQFDTKRPPVGQLLYELKYTTADKQAKADDLADTAADFVRRVWRLTPDAIVPVPPSNNRSVQPVTLVVHGISARLGVPVCSDCLTKVKQTPQLKDIKDYDKRREVLKDAFQANPTKCAGKSLLLFDDLHGSGATTGHIVEVLKAAGARAVYLLTLTTK